MDYEYLPDPIEIHDRFLRRYTLPYGAFCRRHADWLAKLPMTFRRSYTQDYFARLPYSDRLVPEFTVLSFEDALAQLRGMGTVTFLTSPPGGVLRDHARFGTERLWAARAEGTWLSEAVREDWFRTYALWDQGMYDPEPLFGSEVYAFSDSACLIFTHETDETELPETRICLSYADKQP